MANIETIDYEELIRGANITFQDTDCPLWGDIYTLQGVNVMIQKCHKPDNPVYLVD